VGIRKKIDHDYWEGDRMELLKNKISGWIVIIVMGMLCGMGCGKNSIISTEGGGAEQNISNADILGTAELSLSASYPADLQVSHISELENIAFVLHSSNPSGILPVDISQNSLQLSDQFPVFLLDSQNGYPNAIQIVSAELGYVLTSSQLIAFNPTTAELIDFTPFPIRLSISSDQDLYYSDGTLMDTNQLPVSTPTSLTVVGNRICVGMASYTSYAPPIAAPGVVLVYEMSADNRLSFKFHTLMSGYNPASLTAYGDDELLVMNIGVIAIEDGQARMTTAVTLDHIDLTSNAIMSSTDLGDISPYDQPMVVDNEGIAYFGSINAGNIYAVDLNELASGPLVVSHSIHDESDYITGLLLSSDKQTLIASSFNRSRVYKINVSDMSISQEYLLSDFANDATGAITGVGRVDMHYTENGEHVYALTGDPGKILRVTTID